MMSDWRGYRQTALACGVTLGCFAVARAWACVDDDPIDRANLMNYLGFVRDQDGKPVPDTRVTIPEWAHGSNTVIHTSNGGTFMYSIALKSDPAELQFYCEKAGYQKVLGQKTPSATEPHFVLVTCSMRRK